MKDFIAQLNKIKNRRYLVLSAGGPQSGIQGILFSIEGKKWSILSQALMPYPEQVEEIITIIMKKPQTMLSVDTICRLDFKISQLFLECAKTVCAAAQKSLQQPHAIVLNKLNLLKEPQLNDLQSSSYWNIEIGDARLLSSWFKTPAITDFVRNSIILGNKGDLPLFPGISRIKADNEVIIAHCTIGMLAHLFIFDTHANHIIIDTDIGPGTCLINKGASESNCPDRFDRDGSESAQGKVDTGCLEILASQEVFCQASPRQVSLSELMKLYDHPCLKALAPRDKLATFTALTARATFDVYKSNYRHVVKPETIWVSGGGANNLTLLDFLTTYFAPIPVKRIDDVGVTAELFVPLALGLTVDAYCMGDSILKSGNIPEFEGIGTWVFPK
jgi:anhydro-N-acetylmuramic acid kinase